MGYSTKTVSTKNYQEIVGASFNSVGAEALDIQDIVLANDGENGGSWIKWWDPATKTYSDKVVYANPLCDPVTDDDLDYGGWGDEVNWYPTSKTFAPGEGFWFCAGRANVGITTAGAVEKTANQYVGRNVTTKNHQIMVLNAFPTTLNIQSIVLDNDGANGGSWIKWWDSATKTYSDKVVYANPLCDPVTDDDLDYGGWGDEVNWYPTEKTFEVGEGFWFCAGRANVTICFPNPFYVAPEEP